METAKSVSKEADWIVNVGEAEALMEKENALENHGLFKMDESGVVVKDLETLKGLNKMIATTDGTICRKLLWRTEDNARRHMVACLTLKSTYDNVISYS